MNENNGDNAVGFRPQNQQSGELRPSLAIYHANAKGTGCAMKMNLHPAHDLVEGSVMMSLATQKSVGDRTAETPTYSTFGWDGRITVKLGFADICQILQVLRGECESVGDGKGLYHQSPDWTTHIVFRHMVTPIAGYSLEFYRSPARRQGEDTTAHMFFYPSEALGLSIAFEHALPYVCFGIPKVIPHDTSAYRERVRAARSGHAA